MIRRRGRMCVCIVFLGMGQQIAFLFKINQLKVFISFWFVRTDREEVGATMSQLVFPVGILAWVPPSKW